MMQTDKKQKKPIITTTVVRFWFIPVMKVKTIRTQDYITSKYLLFCFVPLCGIERAVPSKEVRK
jgi:hypothetical protein